MEAYKADKGFTLIEILVVISIIAILAALLIPTFTIVQTIVKKSLTQSLLANIGHAAELYSVDFSGRYPADTLEGGARFLDGGLPKNSSQWLCYVLESEMLSDEGRSSGNYLTFRSGNKELKGKGTTSIMTLGQPPVTLRTSFDFVIDAFHNPIVYDERMSEGDYDGLNNQSFVLISGGPGSKRAVDLSDIEGLDADLTMWTTAQKGAIDTLKTDYADDLNNLDGNSDDILNR